MLALNVATTFATALVASALSLITQFHQRYRPFGRRSWWYTLRAAMWLAVVTTAVIYLVTTLVNGPMPAQVWALLAPPAASGMRSAFKRGRRPEEGPSDASLRPSMQVLTLFLPPVLGWLEAKLSSFKDEKVQEWAERIKVTSTDPDLLIERLAAKLRDRHLPGSAELRRQLEAATVIYREAHEAWSTATAATRSRTRLRGRLDIAFEGILRVAYEARADQLITASRPRPRRRRRKVADVT